jgi:hypothetical protein
MLNINGFSMHRPAPPTPVVHAGAHLGAAPRRLHGASFARDRKRAMDGQKSARTGAQPMLAGKRLAMDSAAVRKLLESKPRPQLRRPTDQARRPTQQALSSKQLEFLQEPGVLSIEKEARRSDLAGQAFDRAARLVLTAAEQLMGGPTPALMQLDSEVEALELGHSIAAASIARISFAADSLLEGDLSEDASSSLIASTQAALGSAARNAHSYRMAATRIGTLAWAVEKAIPVSNKDGLSAPDLRAAATLVSDAACAMEKGVSVARAAVNHAVRLWLTLEFDEAGNLKSAEL